MRKTQRPADSPGDLFEKGMEEQEKATEQMRKYLRDRAKAIADGKKLPTKPSITYKMYKDLTVKEVLVEIFDGKCAYCESFYSSTQPMDVEHYRPKGAVDGDDEHLGYYWLAATWENLLPSCIDCNRKRGQFDVVEEENRKLGKMDRFPIEGTRARDPDDDLSLEDALLVDPTVDDPEQIFRFDREFGVVIPRFKSGKRHRRAMASIEVYGLNRSGLVTDRLHIIRQIDHHLRVIELLTLVRDGLTTSSVAHLRDIVVEVIELELDALFSLADSDRPYAGMAKQLLDGLTPR
ncbi:hypothetical protein [Ilumatobacter sp.]|uniref:hypothetical protein n=1 Tax=Ilumatobacter sp. TaxID=1967498 RepID=UPI003C48672C